MTAQEIRKIYLEFFQEKGHAVLPRASLVPQDDPTTLFTGSGMQPLIPYLLGQTHPAGKRIVDSQTCFRAEDMDEVGDNRHTTFFEMLGNWSLGDYFKAEQLEWFWEFLTKELGLDPQKLYVTCFFGDEMTGIAKDTESAKIWKELFSQASIDAAEVDLPAKTGCQIGMQGGRIFYYDSTYNWWSREGAPNNMQVGEPGGPDSEAFYDVGTKHDHRFGRECHPNCECGRFLEIGNSVFMTYKKTADGFTELPQKNVDFGGGLERLAAAVNNDPDIFKVSLIAPIITSLENLSGKKYQEHPASMRVIADHLRAATMLAADGVSPSNKEQGYVLRRLIRRAVRFALDLGVDNDLTNRLVPVVVDVYRADFPEIERSSGKIVEILNKEERIFRQTLRKGLSIFHQLTHMEKGRIEQGKKTDIEYEKLNFPVPISGRLIFKLYDTYGFPVELSVEEAKRNSMQLSNNWEDEFKESMDEQRKRSQTASKGMFRGGLADASDEVVELHTATHLMYQALKEVLGKQVIQRGSNITSQRTRFDFSHSEKMTPEQIKQVEDIVNQKIVEDLPVNWKEEKTEEALKTASGAFGDKYGDKVKVYTIGDNASPYSREVCGGPHVEHTGQIGQGGKHFKIVKEESSSAGVRRIKAVLQ